MVLVKSQQANCDNLMIVQSNMWIEVVDCAIFHCLLLMMLIAMIREMITMHFVPNICQRMFFHSEVRIVLYMKIKTFFNSFLHCCM